MPGRVAGLLLFWMILGKIGVTDAKSRQISNRRILFLAGLAAGSLVWFPEISLQSHLGGAVFGGALILLPALMVSGSFGGGDLKLLLTGGFFLGFTAVLWAVTAAVAAAGIYAVYLLIFQKADKKTQFAFGPFLCLGMFAASLRFLTGF